MATIGKYGATSIYTVVGVNVIAPDARTLPQGTITRILKDVPPHFHAVGSTSQATQSTTAAAHVEYHAGGVTAQAAQSTQGAGRVVYHAASVTAQATQIASAAGRIVYHAGAATIQAAQVTSGAGRVVHHAAGITVQGAQAMTAFGRVVYHAAGGSQQARQSTSGTGRVEYHAGGATGQPAQSMAALGHVVPFVGVIGTISTSQRSQSMAASGTVTNPAAPEQPGNVARYIHAAEAGDFGKPIEHIRGNGSSVQAAQLTEARGRVVPMSRFHVQDTRIHVFEEGRAAGRQPEGDRMPLPLPVANSPAPAVVASNEVTDDELAFIFAIAA